MADTGLTLQLRETAGSSSGRVIGEHETISAAYSLLLEECQSRHLLLLYIWNVMLLFAFICVIKKNDGLLSWLGRASVLISRINYYTIRYTQYKNQRGPYPKIRQYSSNYSSHMAGGHIPPYLPTYTLYTLSKNKVGLFCRL